MTEVTVVCTETSTVSSVSLENNSKSQPTQIYSTANTKYVINHCYIEYYNFYITHMTEIRRGNHIPNNKWKKYNKTVNNTVSGSNTTCTYYTNHDVNKITKILNKCNPKTACKTTQASYATCTI